MASKTRELIVLLVNRNLRVELVRGWLIQQPSKATEDSALFLPLLCLPSGWVLCGPRWMAAVPGSCLDPGMTQGRRCHFLHMCPLGEGKPLPAIPPSSHRFSKSHWSYLGHISHPQPLTGKGRGHCDQIRLTGWGWSRCRVNHLTSTPGVPGPPQTSLGILYHAHPLPQVLPLPRQPPYIPQAPGIPYSPFRRHFLQVAFTHPVAELEASPLFSQPIVLIGASIMDLLCGKYCIRGCIYVTECSSQS